MRSGWFCWVRKSPVACSSRAAVTNAAAADAGDPVERPATPAAPPPIDAAPAPLACDDQGPDWPMFGQNLCNTRSPRNAGALTKANAAQLGVKWTLKASGDLSATPAVSGGSGYVPDWGGLP